MRLGHRITGLCLALVTVGLGVPPAQADDAEPTTLAMSGRAGHAEQSIPLALDLAHSADSSPVADAAITVERRTDGDWAPIGSVETDESGHAELDASLARTAGNNVFRASYAGDGLDAASQTGPVQVDLVRRNSRVRLTGPDSVVDEQRVTLEVRWTTGNGAPVAGNVRILRRAGNGTWQRRRTVRTGADGRVSLTTRPRTDTRWRAQVVASDWLRGDTSGVHRVDNLPPGVPVRYPGRAPRPRVHVPRQPHAVGAGPNISITRIRDPLWKRMTGKTWHRGCPVGRSRLRHVRINYWDYRGYRRRGELVANADAAGRIAAALAEMYDHKLPIRAMYLVSRFGWSSKVKGGDDLRSMAAGNTSVFNCREVVNKPGVRSPHAWGRALDLNTWENPYRSARGTVPNTWWQPHSHRRIAWRSRSHDVVAIMARHGLRWTYGLGDTQHFDAAAGNGRYLSRPVGCDGVCD